MSDNGKLGERMGAGSYDEFLGGFVDSVQLEPTAFRWLTEAWTARCAGEWRERFAADCAEIGGLIEAGVFGSTEDGASQDGQAEDAA